MASFVVIKHLSGNDENGLNARKLGRSKGMRRAGETKPAEAAILVFATRTVLILVNITKSM